MNWAKSKTKPKQQQQKNMKRSNKKSDPPSKWRTNNIRFEQLMEKLIQFIKEHICFVGFSSFFRNFIDTFEWNKCMKISLAFVHHNGKEPKKNAAWNFLYVWTILNEYGKWREREKAIASKYRWIERNR